MPKILAVGVGLVDIYPQLKKMYPGGNEYNISWYVRELGGESSFMGVFAPDRVGSLLSGLMQNHGVDISHSRYRDGYSNYALVELEKGNRVFTDWSKTAVTDRHPIRFTDEDLQYIHRHQVVCAGYASRLPLSEFRLLYRKGVAVCYDFSDSFTEERLQRYAPLVRYAFLSCSHLGDEAIHRLLAGVVDLGPACAVATMGERGALSFDGSRYDYQPALPADVVDTMGAGDSFIAGFLYSLYGEKEPGVGLSIPRALQHAARFAQKNICREGALGIGYDVDPTRLADMIGKEF